MIKVGFIGMGNFGFALASHLSRCQKSEVELWVYDRKQPVREQLQATHTHPFLYPTVTLADNTQVASSMNELASNCEIIVLAVVSTALGEVLENIKADLKPNCVLLSTMKALSADNGQPLSSLISEKLGNYPHTVAAFAGGTTAVSLTKEEYLGATIACENSQVGEKLAQIFASPYLRIQLTNDVLGTEYAGSFKNLISVLVGLLKGLGFDYGTQTHGLSLIASECQQLAVSLGAQADTFSFASQCWGNDMVMSATGETRNHQLGLLLGEGNRFSQAKEQMQQNGKTAESTNTLAILPKIADLTAYPLLDFLTKLSQEQVSAHQVIKIIETHQ